YRQRGNGSSLDRRYRSRPHDGRELRPEAAVRRALRGPRRQSHDAPVLATAHDRRANADHRQQRPQRHGGRRRGGGRRRAHEVGWRCSFHIPGWVHPGGGEHDLRRQGATLDVQARNGHTRLDAGGVFVLAAPLRGPRVGEPAAMIRLAALLVALLAFAGVAHAESPVEVTADTFTVDQAKSEALFSGNVVVKRSDLTVWAERVLVTFGEGGLENIQHIVATGRV